jgi:two-component system, NarL family, nitrate/nitrite response regulator NarL
MPVRVLLADDNALFREGMASLLLRCPDVEVVGQATSTSEAVRTTLVLRPDVVLLDLSMPGGGGVAAIRAILVGQPDQTICMLTSSEQHADLFTTVRAGARGYLVKSVEAEEVCAALHTLAAGGSVISPHLAAWLLEEFARLADRMPTTTEPRLSDALTPREHDVLRLVGRGASNQEIAEQLVLAENTVKVHLRNMLDKVKLHNRAQLAALAVQEGVVRNARAPLHEVAADGS